MYLTSHRLRFHIFFLLHPYTLFFSFFFFFNDTATTEIYTLSLHDALPIYCRGDPAQRSHGPRGLQGDLRRLGERKSTRLNSSHSSISYDVFCLKKKKNKNRINTKKKITTCASE